MTTFKRIEKSTHLIGAGKLVYGVGINDADYVVQPTVNGKRVCCPIYDTWKKMIERCYSAKCQERHPTYVGCTVADEWLRFSTFAPWMKKQQWEGNQLDKDLLVHGNKIYSPDTCLFVPQEINLLFIDNAADRGEWPLGVSLRNGRYRAQCRISNAQKYLGMYSTPEEAHSVYLECKRKHIIDIAVQQSEPLRSALIRRVIASF